MKNALGGLMQQVQKMQEMAQQAQQEISLIEITGESGAGLVKITINGRHEARQVTIDPSLLEDDKDMLEDMIAAAINDANRKLEKTIQDKFAGLTGGMNLPGNIKLPF